MIYHTKSRIEQERQAIVALACAAYCAYGQPMPPMSAAPVSSEPPQTFTALCAWDKVSAPATGLRLTISNAATSYTAHLPITATNHSVQVVLGTNWISLASTNSTGAGTAYLTSVSVVSNWCEFICLGKSSLTSNWQRIDPRPQLVDKPMLFAQAAISNWATTNWRAMP